jgi:hypothetical protein
MAQEVPVAVSPPGLENAVNRILCAFRVIPVKCRAEGE